MGSAQGPTADRSAPGSLSGISSRELPHSRPQNYPTMLAWKKQEAPHTERLPRCQVPHSAGPAGGPNSEDSSFSIHGSWVPSFPWEYSLSALREENRPGLCRPGAVNLHALVTHQRVQTPSVLHHYMV